MNAVFYKTRKQKNIFNVMNDNITELKAMEVQHEKKTTAQLEAFNRQLEDMGMTISNHTTTVDSF